MTDRDFELLLEEQIAALPPGDELVAAITPWRTAMNRILIGTGLMTISLNFLLLDTILPAIGMVMMLLGFRALRRENRWFALGYGITVLRTAYSLVWIFLKATVFYETAQASPAALWAQYVIVAANLLQVLSLTQGIRAVRRKAGSDAYAGGATALLVMNILMTVLAFWNYSGILVWGFLAIYILTLRALWNLSKALDDAGYTVEATPILVSDRAVKIFYTTAIFLCLTIGYLFFSQYPVQWQEAQPQPQSHMQLEALGFPGYVLEDLTDEEILALQDARTVYVQTEELAVNDGIRVSRTEDNVIHVHTEYPIKELLLTHVAVELADGETWMVFHHFLWSKMPFYRGTEAIKIWPAYREGEGWAKGTHLSGRILYDRNGTTFSSSFYSLEERTFTSNTFFGPKQNTDLIAAFALPLRGKKCRGYVCYDMKMREEGWSINSWCNYFYQTRPNYPIQTADDFAMSGFILGESAFRKCQSALQLWPEDLDGSSITE